MESNTTYIPFAVPLIDQDVINEMMDLLTHTKWLTSGPKVKQLELEIAKITETPVVCVNSWTSGAMLVLRWFGVGPGDEVIIPAYTYAATALSVMNMGAKVVMVDVSADFTMDHEQLRAAITPRTKVILPVDVGGLPCHYDAIMDLVTDPSVKGQFVAQNDQQIQLGRILVVSDAAHSLGARYRQAYLGRQTDVTIFSLHSVKNVTSGEGGAIALHLPPPYDNQQVYSSLKVLSLNGQTKSAFEKNIPGAWRYDIIDQGLKVNMPDLCAAVGLAQIKKYISTLLPERKAIFAYYDHFFRQFDWAILPFYQDEVRESSAHLYMLRIEGFEEVQRDQMIQLISEANIGVNVHYIPMPMLSFFKSQGYRMEDYPTTYQLYKNEISLPIYNGLTEDQLDRVCRAVRDAYQKVK